MKTMMFNKFVHPCVVIRLPADAGVGAKVSGDVTLGVGVDIEFALCPELLEEAMVFRRAAIRCRPLALLGCTHVLQAWMPSYHVWPSLELRALPQFPDQEPPRPQQLGMPDFTVMPHLRHSELMVVVVAAGRCECESSSNMWALVKGAYRKAKKQVPERTSTYIIALALNLRLHACMPSDHL